MWKELAIIVKALDQRFTAELAEQQLPPLVGILECGNRLAMNAAGMCFEAMRAVLGEDKLLSMLDEAGRAVVSGSEFVQ